MNLVRLKHVAHIDYGLGQPPPLSDSGVPILRATNINRGRITELGLIFADMHELPLRRTPLLQEGEILVVRSGAYTGDSAIVTSEWAGSAPGYDLRVTATAVHPQFLAYCLLSAAVLDKIDLAKTRAAQPHLNAEDLGDIEIPARDLDEQRRIADFLDSETIRIDGLTKSRVRQRETLDELKQSITDDAVGRLSGCPRPRLGYLARVQTGVTVDGGRRQVEGGAAYPYLRVANVQVGYLDLNDVAEMTVSCSAAAASKLRAGDVLMTEGGDLDKLGRGTVWRGEIEECLHQNHVFAVRPDGEGLVADYLALLTRASFARQYFESTGNKTTNLASTSSSKIRDFRIPLPDVSTQNSITNEVEDKLAPVAHIEERIARQLDLLAERRQALITAAVTGQIDVTAARGVEV